ncbi:MAG: phosphoribosylpyrophosphate synthetase [Bacteroidota bacterium]|jgi:ribose-phosphate pyrophosphokinase
MKTILNLDRRFRPLNGEEINYEAFTFAGGELHIKLDPTDLAKSITITHRLNAFSDIGLLYLAADALRRSGVKRLDLFIPYFPAARQDRLMVEGEPLSVKVYADLINQLNFETVTILDPHSDVTPAVLNRCVALSNHAFMHQVVGIIGSDALLISPDGGALKKIYKVSEALNGMDVVECSKSRDVKTGRLSGFKVYADDLQGRPCIIVDDICDGGGTFLGLAKELKAKNAGALYLAVSHGIFSKGTELLTEVFDHIFMTDSVKELQSDKMTTLALSTLIYEQL